MHSFGGNVPYVLRETTSDTSERCLFVGEACTDGAMDGETREEGGSEVREFGFAWVMYSRRERFRDKEGVSVSGVRRAIQHNTTQHDNTRARLVTVCDVKLWFCRATWVSESPFSRAILARPRPAEAPALHASPAHPPLLTPA